ncbi:MAG: PDZ domain-containing protein [Deltaproteobacteria bacterium]|nr:PDZ domain-containing protein [Deltaproteobacteria bacterium]
MRRSSTRIIGFALVAVVLGLAAFLTFFSDGRGGLEIEPTDVGSGDGYDSDEPPASMGGLRALYKTINLIQKHYIDPSRIDSRSMLVAAMRAIQRQVAEVLVREDGDDLVVRLGADERRFSLADVSTPWILLQRAREVFDFVRSGVSIEDVDFQEVEYSAINGMLHTLDPHSALLPPDLYRDMKDKTQGQFGGLGIVISIRDGALTIISPIDGTPADLAGLEAGDQIVKIGEVSTVSMPLNDAVNLLRGKPGTTVRVYVLRKGWEEARPFDIVRAIIEVQSVESHMLTGRVGYVRIKDFQGNTRTDLLKQLAELERKGLRGLVVDLRNNPGGLLEAAIQVADIFVDKGVLVTTAGQGPAERDVRRAVDDGIEPSYPVVVLVNSGSASASEIVAGALKNHRRALTVGQRTFGKGSVQVLYDYNDGSALKLTTAQYLTPGDISIQGVGVVPDVELLPMRADEEMLDLKVDAGYRESDLDRHFEDVGASVTEGLPTTSLRYLWVPPKKKKAPVEDGEQQEEGEEEPADGWVAEAARDEKFKPDFEIDLARELVQEMAGQGMTRVDPARLGGVLERRADKEQQRLVAALKKMGIDWRVGDDDGPVRPEVVVALAEQRPLVAGEKGSVTVSVTNHGASPLYQLLATSRSDFRPLEDKELAFGRVDPGQTIERKLEFKVPKDALSRVDDVVFSFEEASDRRVHSVGLRFEVEALPEPRFAYAVQTVDIEGGNGDGRLQNGEKVRLLVDIDNVGVGKALSTYATLKSLSGKEVFLTKGREKIGVVPRGEQRQAVFEFEVRPGFKDREARFELAVMDVDLRVYSIEKLSIPIAEPLSVVQLDSPRTMVSRAGTRVLESPSASSRTVARLLPDAAVVVDAESGEFARVGMAEGRFGWVERLALEGFEGSIAESPVELAINAPPELVVAEVVRVVRQPTITIRGSAVDESRVRDIYVFVGEDKVFFMPNTDVGQAGKLEFQAELPLEKGLNYITVVAEETADLDTRLVFAVRRDRVDGMGFVASKALNGKPEALGVRTEKRPDLAP